MTPDLAVSGAWGRALRVARKDDDSGVWRMFRAILGQDPPMTPADETLTIRMPARAWATMDGETDNTGAAARVDGPEEWALLAEAIRAQGWRQVPWVGGEWPPMEQEIAITLTRVQWAFVLEQVEAGVAVSRSLDDEESVALGDDAVRVLRGAGV